MQKNTYDLDASGLVVTWHRDKNWPIYSYIKWICSLSLKMECFLNPVYSPRPTQCQLVTYILPCVERERVHSYVVHQFTSTHGPLFGSKVALEGKEGPAHAKVATPIAWVSPDSKREDQCSLSKSPSLNFVCRYGKISTLLAAGRVKSWSA